jgi:hypothetical protein
MWKFNTVIYIVRVYNVYNIYYQFLAQFLYFYYLLARHVLATALGHL